MCEYRKITSEYYILDGLEVLEFTLGQWEKETTERIEMFGFIISFLKRQQDILSFFFFMAVELNR